MLVRLLYASRASDDYTAPDLGGILQESKDWNARHEITGVLLSDNCHFLQCLEGPRDEVTFIFAKIAQDPRHTNVQLVDFHEASQRHFHGWAMKYTPSADVMRKLTQQTGLDAFEPLQLNAYQARRLIETFDRSLPKTDPQTLAPTKGNWWRRLFGGKSRQAA
ncbi:MAG: BLUF domain-containing protein [Candidatus Competibacterales bacterium]